MSPPCIYVRLFRSEEVTASPHESLVKFPLAKTPPRHHYHERVYLLYLLCPFSLSITSPHHSPPLSSPHLTPHSPSRPAPPRCPTRRALIRAPRLHFFTSVCHLLLYSFLHHYFYLTILHLPLYSSLYSLFFSCSFFPCYLDTLLCCLQIAFIFTFILCRNTYSLLSTSHAQLSYLCLPVRRPASLSEPPHLPLVCVALTCLLTVYFFLFFSVFFTALLSSSSSWRAYRCRRVVFPLF